jgi:glycosyltransferase involved in cell wall biosynthesis
MVTIRSKKYDLVVVTSGRLGSAVLGAVIARLKSSLLYLDLRENAPNTIRDIFKSWQGAILHTIFSKLERWAIHSAQKINLISPGFLPEYQKNYPNCTFTCYTHAVSPLFTHLNMPLHEHTIEERLKVYYAGTIGYAQQLHLILPTLAQKTAHLFDFYVIGGGNNVVLLENILKKNNIQNVTLLPTLSRTELIPHYQDADILFLHVYPYPFSEKILPSKLFEYAAIGKPIWAGITGFAQQFIEKEINNCAIFSPCNVEDAISSLTKFQLKTISRTAFIHKFNQEDLMKNLANEILSLK